MILRHLIRVAWLFSLWLAIGSPAAAAPTGHDVVLENEKDLVVMVRGTIGESRQEGAGVIVGSDRDGLIIATADHVVRDGDQPVTGLTVRFRWKPEQEVPAALLANRIARSEASKSKIYDLAVLRVAKSAVPPFDLDLLPLDQVGDATELKRGADLSFVGYPQGKAWYQNVSPARFAEVDGELLSFETDALLPGYSGGALLDSNLQLIGLIIETEGTFGTALDFGAIIATIKAWKIPAQIGDQPRNIRFTALSTGYAFSCALGAKGFVYCWAGGAGPPGKDKDDTEDDRQLGRLAGGLRFTSLSVGAYHACGVTMTGEGYCFGSNDEGQLGSGMAERFSSFPEPVAGGLRFRAVSAGESHSCALTVAGQAYCWGEGWKDHPVAVRTSATFDVISSGKSFSCALSKGAAWCWGDNYDGQLGRAGGERSNSYVPVPVRMDPSLSLQQLSSGSTHSCAVAKDGRAVCWGNNDDGQAGAVSEFEAAVVPGQKFISVAAGDATTCGIALDHRAFCWGNAIHGALGSGWTQVVENQAIADEIHRSPVAVQGNHKFQVLSAGLGFFACGLTGDQELLCWGRRHRRSLGYYGDYGSAPQRVDH
jgi:hypothetical protein